MDSDGSGGIGRGDDSTDDDDAEEGLLEGLRVLNLAGSPWDKVLLATGAMAVQSTPTLLADLGHAAADSTASMRSASNPHRSPRSPKKQSRGGGSGSGGAASR